MTTAELVMNVDEHNERSPLLGHQNQESNDHHEEDDRLLCIVDFEHDLYAGQDGFSLITSPQAIEDVVRARSLASQSLNDAIKLVLCIRRISGAFLDVHSTIPPWAVTPAPEIQVYVLALWKRISTESNDDDLNEILWTSFRLRNKPECSKSFNVIEVLLFSSLTSISMDIRLCKALTDKWRIGNVYRENHGASFERQILPKYTLLVTPRVLHLLDLSTYLVYLGLASNYALFPARQTDKRSANAADPRSVLLLVYAISRLLTTEWKHNIHFSLMAISITLSTDFSPSMNDGTYMSFLLALSLHVIQLQLPLQPSPMFLFPSLKILPISCIFYTIIKQIFIPAFLFFLPVLILVSFLLSMSLSDVFILIRSRDFFEPAPENARVAFLMLGSLVLVFFSCLITCMVLASPTVASTQHSVLSWDSYGSKVGLATRRTIYSAVKHYSRPQFFPAPLNLLETLLVNIPCALLRFFKKQRMAKRVEYALKNALWICCVFPLGLCFASFWLWGLI